ncbi:hypothetical protein B0H65DRAFT_413551 [Neurospora tetraspora]|uniref:Uncharacterized protein n=1 Tax=Neurospora tetraspora TaxID=94610 RepID=A0AAE0MXM1_9PEZI|nr:hypothetical protein B0H65DRAFT_413551 [Neurospora tetraspora]
MDFFLPFMGVLGSQALLSARNILGAEQSTKTTSTESASTYQDPWSDSSIGSSESDKPAGSTMTSEKERCANSDTGAVKKEKKDPKTTHIGADVSASKSDESKVTTDRKLATGNSDDEMILDCITVNPDPSDFDTSLYDTPSSPADYEPVAGSPKKRNWAAPMAASLFDEIHSPSPKRRLIRSPPTTDSSFNTAFNNPPRNIISTENVDPQADTQTPSPSKIRLRLTCPTPMAVFNRVNRTSDYEPEVSNNSVGGAPELTDENMERPKAGESVDKTPKAPPRRRIRQRISDKSWAELNVVDKKGFLDTWANKRTPPRRKLQECKWVRYPKPEGYVPTPGEDPWVPRLVLTDPAGWHYSLEDLRFPTQRALPGI